MTDKIRAALAELVRMYDSPARRTEGWHLKYAEVWAAARAAIAEPEAVPADEWAAFMAWRDDYSRHSDPCAWPAWQARAAWSNRSTAQQWPRPDAAEKVEPIGDVVVTKNEAGQIVAVTRQDHYGHILSVIAIAL